jgi:serine/threonine protein kinase
MQTITFHFSQDITQICNDTDLINKLKDERKLNSSVEYALQCPSGINYTADTLLGTGSFNEVWSLKNNTDRVLRITKLGMKTDDLEDEITGLFLQSYMSKTTDKGGIGCPYICQVYEFGYVDKGKKSERVYAILERLSVSELSKKIRELKAQKPTPYLNLGNIFYQILQGLECMHSHEYVHLDMKTKNVGLDANYNAKIFDFGFARYIPKTKQYISLGLDQWVGTSLYVDPFFYYYGNFSLKSDVYSVGVMMIKTYFYFTEKDEVLDRPKFYANKKSWDEFYRFWFDNEVDYYEQTKYNQISHLINLVQWMTYPDIDTRCSSQQAIEHEWFTEIIQPPVLVSQSPRQVKPKLVVKLTPSQETLHPRGGKKSRKIYLKKRKTIKKRRQSSFVKSRRSSRR